MHDRNDGSTQICRRMVIDSGSWPAELSRCSTRRRDVIDDAEAMARALVLAERGRATTAPNPWVGCVIMREGRVVGEGYHRVAGGPHAEVEALQVAGVRAHGATAYVTLEPCAHYGRTPPCADALIRAGVARVVVALCDPDRRVAGRGVDRLRRSGLAVEVGPGAEFVTRSLAAYCHHRRTGRAFCVAKAAISLDGRTAAADGSSQWITGAGARSDAHRLRAESQAVVLGARTAIVDAPTLTARGLQPPAGRQPLRVVLDARGWLPASGPLFETSSASTLVMTTLAADRRRVASWQAAGAEVLALPAASDGHGVDLKAALDVLGARGVLQALVEGGPTLHGALARERLINRFVLYVGARTLGQQGYPLLAGPGPRTLATADRWRLLGISQVGEDARLEYEPLEVAQG